MRSYSPPNPRRLVRRIAAEIRAALAAGRPVYVTLELRPGDRARIRVANLIHHRSGAASWVSDHGTLYLANAPGGWATAVVEWAA